MMHCTSVSAPVLMRDLCACAYVAAGVDLRVALDAALAGSSLPADFKPRPSIGCNIK